ncbi:MAG: glycosyl transferase [Herbinix sp.]|nr:glycosyl transferase [Herbinix sp.]
MSTISLCMIVKDEESNIRRCLDSIKSIIDEIIIVDTGSSDKTKDICSEFTDKLYDYQWNGNFADARNFSIQKASSDWILWMDADEELYIKSISRLKENLDLEEIAFFSIKMLHILVTAEDYDKQPYISYNYRLFRNRLDFKFEGAIHEKLLLKGQMEEAPICNCIQILHYGYSENSVLKKANRNLELLLEKKNRSDEPWLDYHIAAELYRLQDYETAFQFVNQSIVGFLSQGILPPSLAYKLKYDLLIHSNNMEHAYQGIEKAIELYPDYVELHFYRGVILYFLKQYETAVKAFTYCLILGENNPHYLIRSGSGSSHAYYYLGECYTKMGMHAIAQAAYQQAALS